MFECQRHYSNISPRKTLEVSCLLWKINYEANVIFTRIIYSNFICLLFSPNSCLFIFKFTYDFSQSQYIKVFYSLMTFYKINSAFLFDKSCRVKNNNSSLLLMGWLIFNLFFFFFNLNDCFLLLLFLNNRAIDRNQPWLKRITIPNRLMGGSFYIFRKFHMCWLN